MLYYRVGDRFQVQNDPDGFVQLHEACDDTDIEIQKWKYFRLTNKGKTLLSVRCLGLVYGGTQRH